MRLSDYNNFTFLSNDNEVYFTYYLIPDKKKNIYTFNNTVNAYGVSRFVIDVSGQFKELILMPNKEWDVFWSQLRGQCAKSMLFVGHMEVAKRIRCPSVTV